jgi:hypothetical protein
MFSLDLDKYKPDNISVLARLITGLGVVTSY